MVNKIKEKTYIDTGCIETKKDNKIEVLTLFYNGKNDLCISSGESKTSYELLYFNLDKQEIGHMEDEITCYIIKGSFRIKANLKSRISAEDTSNKTIVYFGDGGWNIAIRENEHSIKSLNIDTKNLKQLRHPINKPVFTDFQIEFTPEGSNEKIIMFETNNRKPEMFI